MESTFSFSVLGIPSCTKRIFFHSKATECNDPLGIYSKCVIPSAIQKVFIGMV